MGYSLPGLPHRLPRANGCGVAENLMPIQVGDMTVVTRHEVAHAKPNPELLLEATRRLRVDPSTPWR